MQDYSAFTDEQLTDELHRLDDQVQALKAAARTAHAELDRRAAERKAAGTLAGLSEAERAALAQLVRAEGIASGEGFGTPRHG